MDTDLRNNTGYNALVSMVRDEFNGCKLWATACPNNSYNSIEMWAANGLTFMIQRFQEGGWEVYVCAALTNHASVTIEALRNYLKEK